MNWQKNLILAAIGVVVWLLVIEWSEFQAKEEAKEPSFVDQGVQAIFEQPGSNNTQVTYTPPAPKDDRSNFTKAPAVEQKIVTITTDVIKVTINTLGGDIVETKLLNHLDKMPNKGGKPISILTNSNGNKFIAQSGLIGNNATDRDGGKVRPTFTTSATSYQLNEGDQNLDVDFIYNHDGVEIIKRFEFKPSDYQIGIRYIVRNLTPEPWSANVYGLFMRDSHQPEMESSPGMAPYLGAALHEEDKNYSKYDFSDINDEEVKTTIKGGWLAFVQHYFVSAWVPPQESKNRYLLRKGPGDTYLMSVTGKTINVVPGSTEEYKIDLYVGPKNQDVLKELSEYLDLTIDYGFLWMLAKPIFAALQIIQGFLTNWGWSIILLTIFIKILLYPLSAASLKSMAKMRTLQPEMARIKELYGDDRQKAGQEQMALFKKHQVNPLGGCFPMLLQMPVFIALYWVLSESVEIRHSPWIFWIQDLSAKDPLFILPLIMGASMFLMQKLQPAPTDPMQAKVFQLMPIMFTFFFMMFPAGLVLYWTVNNLLSILQQWYVNRQIAAAAK